MDLPPFLTKLLSYGEAIAFVAAAVLGAIAAGNVTSHVGHDAIIAGAIGAALHGLTHNAGAAPGGSSPTG